MAKFITILDGNFIRGSINFKLESPLVYERSDETIITAPVGFVTNFASIPRCLRWYIDTDAPEIRDIAVIHDMLYVEKIGTRLEADRILREGMLVLGSTPTKAFLAFLGVRVGGVSHWGEAIL